MIVSIEPGRAGFAIYAISRDENAFVILEGDPLRAETIANLLLKEHQYSHLSFVISFKEEDLTLEQIQEIYISWKKLFLSNYSKKELEIFSVVHFDDQKPHIHCSIMQYGAQSNKDLRLFRGRADFPRNEATTELINYQYNLASHLDNISLLKLTKSQKKRDWKVKKGSRYYRVEDDDIHVFLEKEAKIAKSFDNFIERISAVYPFAKIYDRDTNYLGETTLSLTPQKKFTSFLFNEKWFNRNIASLKTQNFNEVKINLKRKNKRQYEKIYNETTQKHLEHLTKRKVGKEIYQQTMCETILNALKNNQPLYSKGEAPDIEEDISTILKKVGADIFFEDDEKIEYSWRNKRFVHKKIMNDISNETEAIVERKQKIHALNAFDITKYNEKKQFVEELISYCTSGNIQNNQDFLSLLGELGINFNGIGEDTKRGRYLKISKGNGKKVYLYNDFLVSLYELTPERMKEIEIEKKKNLEALKGSFLKTYLNTVASTGIFGVVHPSSCAEYRLHDSPLLDFSVRGNRKEKIFTRINDGKVTDIITDEGDAIHLGKSLDFNKSVENMLEMIRLKGWNSISIDKSSTLYHRLLAEIIKKEIPIVVKDEKSKAIVYDGTKKREKKAKTYFDTLFEENNMDIFLSSLLATEPTNRKNKETIRLLIEEFSTRIHDPLVLKSLFQTLGYNIVRSGVDPVKGKYLTIEKNGQKIALYNDLAAEILKPQNNKISKRDIEVLSFANKMRDNEVTFKDFYQKKELLASMYNISLPDIYKTDISVSTNYNGLGKKVTFSQKDSQIIDRGKSIDVVKTKDMASAASDVLKIAQMKGTPYLDTDDADFAFLLAEEARRVKSTIEIRVQGEIIYIPEKIPGKKARKGLII